MSNETQTRRKAYKGIAMEGIIAKQYDKIQKHMVEEYKSWAKLVSGKVSKAAMCQKLPQVQVTCLSKLPNSVTTM